MVPKHAASKEEENVFTRLIPSTGDRKVGRENAFKEKLKPDAALSNKNGKLPGYTELLKSRKEPGAICSGRNSSIPIQDKLATNSEMPARAHTFEDELVPEVP